MKRIISCLLVLSLVFGYSDMSFSNNTMQTEAVYEENIIQDDIEFRFINNRDGYFSVASYNGNAEELVIPETVDGHKVEMIDRGAFKDNKTLKSVKLPDSIRKIHETAFQNSVIETINIPKSTIMIAQDTFLNCNNLKDVALHEGIIAISGRAFKDTQYEPPKELIGTVSDYGAMFGYDDFYYVITNDNYGKYYATISVSSGNHDEELYFPDEFMGFPVKEMTETAMVNLWNRTITSISFPKYFESPVVITNHPELKKIEFRNENAVIGSFSGSGIEEIILPTDKIAKKSFVGCENLKKITISSPTGSVVIERNAFENCTQLDTIECADGTSITLVDTSAFNNCGFKSIETNYDISANAFGNCNNLTSVTINGDCSVGNSAFINCPNIKDITINGNVDLGNNVFIDNAVMNNINISNLQKINGAAFSNCINLLKINNKYVYDESTNDFLPEYKDFIINSFSSADDVGFLNQYVNGKIKEIVSETVTDEMNDIQKIKALHDWVCRKVSYDDGGFGNVKNHCDASVFMNDSSVCEGYARALNLLMHEAGIETYYVSGVNHAWNIVKLGDNYFHVDSTWDDGDTINYNWFLKCDDEISHSDTNHSAWNLTLPSSLHKFQGNILPKCDYQIGDVNKDGSVSVSDLVSLSNHTLSKSKINEGDIFIADMNYDGNIDVFDVLQMRKKICKAE